MYLCVKALPDQIRGSKIPRVLQEAEQEKAVASAALLLIYKNPITAKISTLNLFTALIGLYGFYV
jgi:hypothetical protein